jgi:putative oxidoreductase
MTLRDWAFDGRTAGSPGGDLGRVLLRVVTGFLLFWLHGINKLPPSDGFIDRVGQLGAPAPELFAWLAAAAEVGGALLVAVGLLTRPAALYVTLHFVIVVLVAHAGDALGDRELPMLFLTIYAFFALAGAGRYSVDALISGGRNDESRF